MVIFQERARVQQGNEERSKKEEGTEEGKKVWRFGFRWNGEAYGLLRGSCVATPWRRDDSSFAISLSETRLA